MRSNDSGARTILGGFTGLFRRGSTEGQAAQAAGQYVVASSSAAGSTGSAGAGTGAAGAGIFDPNMSAGVDLLGQLQNAYEASAQRDRESIEEIER